MTKAYLGKIIKKGPTPSVIFPKECSGIFEDRRYYIIKQSDRKAIDRKKPQRASRHSWMAGGDEARSLQILSVIGNRIVATAGL